jgi:hypothetical protein
MVTKNKDKSTNELLEEISKKLDKILAVISTQGKPIDTQIDILHGFGWEWDEVGKFVDLTSEAARKRYSRK